MKGRKGRPAHRIARCEWVWCRFGDEDGDWEDVEKNREWMGARKAVESLLKKVSRGRASLDEVAEMEWVKGAIDVPGGLRRPDDESEDERLERVERRVRYPFKRMDTSMIVERHSPDES